jgi:hypothetical protein
MRDQLRVLSQIPLRSRQIAVRQMPSLSEVQQLRATGAVEQRFLSTDSFERSKYHAEQQGCDLAVPNASGIGNILVCTALVEAVALQLGRRIRLLTSEMNPLIGKEPQDEYAIWENNPYVKEIVDADKIDSQIMCEVNAEQDNISQFGHMIENVCYAYGVAPRALKPCLYLTPAEQSAAIDRLESIRRPLIAIHAGGTSASTEQSPWYLEKWKELCSELCDEVSFIQVAKAGFDQKCLGIPSPALTLREAMATIWACDMFIGFDSTPAHIATAFSKPSIVLWDVQRKSIIEDRHYLGFAPASMFRWSYPQNRNLMILGQKDDVLLPLCMTHIRTLTASLKR